MSREKESLVREASDIPLSIINQAVWTEDRRQDLQCPGGLSAAQLALIGFCYCRSALLQQQAENCFLRNALFKRAARKGKPGKRISSMLMSEEMGTPGKRSSTNRRRKHSMEDVQHGKVLVFP